MADRCRIVIEAVLKYAQEMLVSTSNLSLPPDLKVVLRYESQIRMYFHQFI